MSKKLSPKVKKSIATMAVAGTVAMSALSLLQSTDSSLVKNLISSGADGGGVNAIKVQFDGENTGIKKYNAYPETKDNATKDAEPTHVYTFSLKNSGKMDQVARLVMGDVAKGASEGKELPKDKVRIVLQTSSGDELFDGSLQQAIDAGEYGFGKCFIIRKDNQKQDYKAYVYIDKSATNDEIYGTTSEGEPHSSEFNLKAIAVQYDGVFKEDGSNQDNLTDEFIKVVGQGEGSLTKPE